MDRGAVPRASIVKRGTPRGASFALKARRSALRRCIPLGWLIAAQARRVTDGSKEVVGNAPANGHGPSFGSRAAIKSRESRLLSGRKFLPTPRAGSFRFYAVS